MNYTTDSIWNQRVRILQPAHGYRFGVDAVLLAHFLRITPHEEALEIGSGSGVVTVLLSNLQRFKRIEAVEIQPELAELCRKNFELNHVSGAEVLEADLKELKSLFPERSFDLIFSNPPYRKMGAGKLNPSMQKTIARHEIQMKLEDLFVCAKKVLKPGGRLSLILPQFREKDFMKLAAKYRLLLKERRYVHSFVKQPPAFFLATVGKAEGLFIEHVPLVIYDSPGCYTTEMNRLLTEQ